ncbi:TPA: hypothetical protein G8N93_005399 [Salmonella enterica]|nr:hypothetical protein [Salmonella enterica]
MQVINPYPQFIETADKKTLPFCRRGHSGPDSSLKGNNPECDHRPEIFIRFRVIHTKL